jgi:DNA-directed RNA polymerase specialized sigma24 family protein
VNTEPSPADRLADRTEQVFAVEARVLARLQEKVWTTQWGLALERLAEALRRSAENRFRGARPTAAEVAAYLQSLHLEDLALACACRDGSEQAWEHFVRQYRQDLYAAARAIVGSAGEARARELADSLYAELYGTEEREGRRRSLFDYFHGRSKLSTWLRAVLAQRHVDALRAAQRTESLDAPPEGSYVPRQLRERAAPADPDRARLLGFLQQALE